MAEIISEKHQAEALEFDDIVDSRTAVEEVVILDTNGVPTPVKIRVLSSDSDEWRKQIYKFNAENAKFREKRKEIPREKQDADSIALLCAVTVGWEGINKGGKPMPCTPENAAALYQKAPFIADQVYEFVRERSNFIRL